MVSSEKKIKISCTLLHLIDILIDLILKNLMIFNHLVTLCHIINKKHSISSSVRLAAIKLDRVVTEGGGL